MVTGDHHLTAIAVAQATGMLNVQRKHVLVMQPDPVVIRGSKAYLPSLSSVVDVPRQLLDRYGQPLRTKSALAMNMASLADFAADESSSSWSKSPNKIDLSGTGQLLSKEPCGRFSSKPLVAKRALPSGSSEAKQPIVTGSSFSDHRSSESSQQPVETTNQTALVSTQAGSSQSKSVQMELASTTLARAQSCEPCISDQLAAHASSSTNDFTLLGQARPIDAGHDRLVVQDALSFVSAEEGQLLPLTESDAKALIAEGHQCIITGPVFEYMLQHAEPVFLETVLRNVAVCARMRSHQKAQLVQLLGTHGLAYTSTRHFKVDADFLSCCAGMLCTDLFISALCNLATARRPKVSTCMSSISQKRHWYLHEP